MPFRSRLAETSEALIRLVAAALVVTRGTRLAGELAAVSPSAPDLPRPWWTTSGAISLSCWSCGDAASNTGPCSAAPRLEHDGSVSVGRRAWDLERNARPEGETEVRASGNGHYYGRFMLAPTPGSVPSVQARRVAATLADLTGSALDTALPGEG
ncbi:MULTISPECIES: hypothetical protein [Streptomyces]|uniref:hypothetical protein n=1 Tax=Streptomyces TaxID=1883 RepID=UPI002257FAB6|nr:MULTISPECIES: hypothetical protein [Streptomyces]MCX4806980.1 hypothetical protein [Streptomyces sp. NBC_01214]MCX5274932.1 hypothetical protein [Streptomyces virginiae]WSQ01886.1 hypothetical protein OG444_32050 [Streptomyces sp. NBC_01232]WSR13445.1 hypothetical protein OG457_09480 [Streptomyces sp. NBC_01207]